MISNKLFKSIKPKKNKIIKSNKFSKSSWVDGNFTEQNEQPTLCCDVQTCFCSDQVQRSLACLEMIWKSAKGHSPKIEPRATEDGY